MKIQPADGDDEEEEKIEIVLTSCIRRYTITNNTNNYAIIVF